MLLGIPVGQSNGFEYRIVKARITRREKVDSEKHTHHQHHQARLRRIIPIEIYQL